MGVKVHLNEQFCTTSRMKARSANPKTVEGVRGTYLQHHNVDALRVWVVAAPLHYRGGIQNVGWGSPRAQPRKAIKGITQLKGGFKENCLGVLPRDALRGGSKDWPRPTADPTTDVA